MSSTVRNVFAIIVGFIVGSVVNGSVVMSSAFVVPPPVGADMSTADGIRAAMTRMQPIHFVMPFLAHALGTLVGALAAAVTAASHKMRFALAIGVLYLLAGTAMAQMVGGPAWFLTLDLGFAYIPMAWVGGKLGMAMTRRTGAAREAAMGH